MKTWVVGMTGAVMLGAALWPRPSAAEPPRKIAEAQKERPSTDDEHVRAGALAGVGFPRPFAIEGLVKLERIVALGAEWSVMPRTSLFGVDTSLWSLAADARLFVFRGMFFVGLRGGYQRADASTTISVAGLGSARGAVGVDTWYVNPRLGVLWTWKPGLTFGADAGLQIPVKSTVSSDLPAIVMSDGRVDTVTALFARDVLPTVDLLRVGWLF
jgi:hypothetical protein